MRCIKRTGVVRGTWLGVVGALAVVSGAPALRAANITWDSNTTFDTGTLDLSGTIVQAVNFGTTSQTVTINNNMATFVASSTLSPPNLGFPSSNDTAAGTATFTNVVGNQPLINLLMSHAFNGPEDVQTLTLTGLIAGQNYQLQAFMFDGRTTGTPALGTLLFHLSDGNGNNSTSVSRNSGTIHVGTFTANATSQNVVVVSDPVGAVFGDPALSGLVLRALTGGTVNAALDRVTGQLTITNNTAGPLDMIGYSVTSAYGSLSQASWLTVSNNYDKPSAPTPGNGSIDGNDAWTILTDPASNGDLSEAELAGGNGGAMAAGATLDLGNVWIKSPTEDVIVKLLRGDGSVFPVPVSYTGNGGNRYAVGDLNFDGALTAADWTTYIAAAQTDLSALSQAEAYQMGDLNGNRANNITDMDLFIDAYDAANGVGAFAAMIAGVPEPSSCALLTIVGVAAAASRRRIRRGAIRLAVAMLATGGLLAASPAMAQVTLNPIVTSGHDLDVVYEIGLTDGATNGANGEFGSRQFYEDGISTQMTPALHKQGLPRTISGFVSTLTTNTINFGFAPFEGNSALKFETASPLKTLALAVPKPYSTLAIAFSGGSIGTTTENGLLSYTINYEGGATQTGMITAPDWGNSPLPTGVERLYAAGRINGGATGANPWPLTPEGEVPTTNPNRWAIYVTEILTTNTTANVLSVDFHTPQLLTIATMATGPLNTGDDIVVFGLAGPGTVEPTALDLKVNKASGLVQITNPTSIAIDINGYEITGANSLNLAGWNSLSDQNLNPVDGPDGDSIVGNGVGETWDEAGGSSNSALMEGFLLGSTSLAPGGSVSLGNAYNAALDLEDLVFKIRKTNGAVSTATVSYISTLPADFDNDGDVDNTDLATWQTNFGSTQATAATGDADGDGDADGNDFLVWQRNVGATPAVASQGAVPEPTGGVLALAACVAATTCRRRPTRRTRMTASAAVGVSLLTAIVVATLATPASAAVTNDREYRFGDDPAEDAANASANIVGAGPLNVQPSATLDSAGVPATGTLHDLLQSGNPVYVNVGPTGLNRPGAAANSLGIQFDGVDDSLFGERLGFPGTTDSSTGGTASGTLDYSGLYNRGFQLWVRPSSGVTTLRDVVVDTNQHGVRINAAGNWVLRYNNADVTSSVPAVGDAWSHVMVVRPYGIVPPNGGGILYVNGVAVAASAGSYNAADDVPLVVGANTGAAGVFGTLNFFSGVMDQLTMFVTGRTLNGVDRGTFNFRADNGFAGLPPAQGGLTGVAGDVNQDGVLNGSDITDFIDGWMTEKRVNFVRVGDVTTIRNGDLNFDGITDIADAYELNNALVLAAGVGLDFSLLPTPEPSTFSLAASALVVGAARRRRRAALAGQVR